jgi:hypothetical protein
LPLKKNRSIRVSSMANLKLQIENDKCFPKCCSICYPESNSPAESGSPRTGRHFRLFPNPSSMRR